MSDHYPKTKRQVTLEDKEPQGVGPNDNEPQALCEDAEAAKGIDAMLKQLSAVIGIDDVVFCSGLLKQVLWLLVGPDGKSDSEQFRFVIAYLKSNRPRDPTESLQRVHLLATHLLTMEYGARLRFAKTLPEADHAERTYNKLERTFLAQCQALSPDRGGGASKVTVDGSQAIVGDVTQGTSEPSSDKAIPSVPLLADAKETPMPLIDEGVVGSGNRDGHCQKKNGK
jgi:hypothetical protein